MKNQHSKTTEEITSSIQFNSEIEGHNFVKSFNKNIEYTSKLLVGIICALKCSSLSTNFIYFNDSNIPIRNIDFFVSYMQRIVVILLISAMIFYLYNIYTI